jgi:gliding motility-associated-like protein
MKSPEKKYIIFLLVFTLLAGTRVQVFATHNRAGEITVRQIRDLTFEITLTTYTYTLSGADRPELEVQWGDETTSIAPRVEISNLPNDYRRNVYICQHTYPGPGTYSIVMQDPNRNYGVKNIPNSVNVIFSIKTIISVNPQIGINSTPVLLNPPFDKAGLYQTFIHNPAAYDPDGDSLSYSLSVCTQQNGEPIPGYKLPFASDTLFVDPVSGDLIWDAPEDTGIYNIAMNISEWRNGIKIGNIVRDMQIEVYRTTNQPPVNDSLPGICAIAGEKLEFDIRSTDPNNDRMKHFLTGGPFVVGVNPAEDSLISEIAGEIITHLTWQTSCEHVRVQPYSIIVKTNDLNTKLSLVDIDNLDINILGPAPRNVSLVPASSLIRVQWKPGECNNISNYRIYRRIDSSGYEPDSCSYGLPGYTGFTLIGSTKSGTDSMFIDDNHGQGLLQGTTYCYRVVALYPDGAESIPSEEFCGILVPGSPAILNTSVIKSDAVSGEILVSWAKPLSLIGDPGPFEYVIKRSDNLFGSGLAEIDRFTTNNLNDTVYIDKNLNTLRFPYSYSVELYLDPLGTPTLFGKPEIASTLYPGLTGSDNAMEIEFVRNVPWINSGYTIFRKNELTQLFDSIAFTNDDNYIDKGLPNGIEKCYQLKAIGKRSIEGIEYPTENLSHIACAVPTDSIPPCVPSLLVDSRCDSLFNRLDWHLPYDSCLEDITHYNVYYTPDLKTAHSLIKSTDSLSFKHFPVASLAGCYFVTAVDSFGNESGHSVNTCVDECINYSIPNVFSPDGDKINDILHPFPYQFVDHIDLKVFNRWGQLIFQTSDPDINWDGKIQSSDKVVSTGVYYYICDVYEKRLTGIEPRNIVGFIHVYTDEPVKKTE